MNSSINCCLARQITNHTCRGGSLTLPVILEQNHIAVRQYHIISLREIRKCSAFSADTRGRVSLQHRMLQMMIDGAVEAPVGTPLPGCPVILEQNHIAVRQYHVISLREIPKM